MAEFDILPIFTDAYLADTRHFTAAQHGAYFLLLMTAWRTKENGLPNDDEKLAKWAAMDKRTWLKNKATILEKWCMIDGLLHQKRLDDERKRAEYVRDRQVQGGLASALKRKKVNLRHLPSEHPRVHQPPSPSPSPISSNEDIDSVDPPKKENRFEEWWSMFPKQRAGAKEKARSAYAKAIKRAAEDEIHEGTIRYIGSDEVARGFAKGAAAWLNDDRWATQYRPANGGNDPNGGGSGQGRAGGNGREPRGVVAAALRVAARLEGKDQNDG